MPYCGGGGLLCGVRTLFFFPVSTVTILAAYSYNVVTLYVVRRYPSAHKASHLAATRLSVSPYLSLGRTRKKERKGKKPLSPLAPVAAVIVLIVFADPRRTKLIDCPTADGRAHTTRAWGHSGKLASSARRAVCNRAGRRRRAYVAAPLLGHTKFRSTSRQTLGRSFPLLRSVAAKAPASRERERKREREESSVIGNDLPLHR